jgi:hypothetical protein
LRAESDRRAAAEEKAEALERVGALKPVVPKWATRVHTTKDHHGIPTLFISDCHFDEVVDPEEVEGSNKYNRAIARMRLERVQEHVIDVARHYFSGIKYDGFQIMFGGDMLSGAIHEELLETNEDTVYGSLDYWSEQLTGFVTGIAKEFGHVNCVGVVGNHGRRTRKPRAKFRVRDNLDWLLYRVVAKATAKVATWNIPLSADAVVSIYGTQIRLTHGDQFRGGAGISGLMAPLMIGKHRKAIRSMSIGTPFDWLAMGHWHEYVHGKGLIVNGSLKGYDEYAYVSNFPPERPTQAFFIVTPENGITFSAPIFADNRKKEGW